MLDLRNGARTLRRCRSREPGAKSSKAVVMEKALVKLDDGAEG